jgi:bacteriocin-like protein
MNQDQIIFEKLTVEELQKVLGGDDDPPLMLPPRPDFACK